MSIILGIIKGFIGDWGLKAVDFYYLNSLWINGILLFYALIVSIAWRNYNSVHIHLMNSVSDQLNEKIKFWSKSEVNKHLNSVTIPWNSASAKIKIPIIAKTGSFKLILASGDSIEKLFPKAEFINSLKKMKIAKE